MPIKTSGLARLKLSTFTQPENTNFSKVSHIIQHGSVSFTLLRINTAGCENLPLPAGLRRTMSRQQEIKQGPEYSTRNQNKEPMQGKKEWQIQWQLIQPKHFHLQAPNNPFLFASLFLLLSLKNTAISPASSFSHLFPCVFLIAAKTSVGPIPPTLPLYPLPAQVSAASSI